MSNHAIRSYSRYSREAVALLGALIRAARREKAMTASELAVRAGISRGLVQRIEKGDLGCEIGAAFEVAAIVGIKLFDADEVALRSRMRRTEEQIALLPQSIRKKESKVVEDDF